MNLFVAIITGLTGLCGSIVAIYEQRMKLQRLRKTITLIGIPAGVQTPEILYQFRDFTDYKKALKSGLDFAVLRVRSLSQALRLCDWVIYDGVTDPKVIDLSNADGRNKLSSLVGDNECHG